MTAIFTLCILFILIAYHAKISTADIQLSVAQFGHDITSPRPVSDIQHCGLGNGTEHTAVADLASIVFSVGRGIRMVSSCRGTYNIMGANGNSSQHTGKPGKTGIVAIKTFASESLPAGQTTIYKDPDDGRTRRRNGWRSIIPMDVLERCGENLFGTRKNRLGCRNSSCRNPPVAIGSSSTSACDGCASNERCGRFAESRTTTVESGSHLDMLGNCGWGDLNCVNERLLGLLGTVASVNLASRTEGSLLETVHIRGIRGRIFV